MKDDALEAYCGRVEGEFFRLKSRPGVLSPSDFARASEWYRAGVPLEVVLEGIANAFSSHAAGRNRDIEEVNSLGYCEPFVEEALRRRNHA